MRKSRAITFLEETSKQIANGTDLLVKKTSDYQTVKKYLTNRLANIKLTAEQQRQLDRYQFIYNQIMCGKYTESEVIKMTMELFGIEYRQACYDLKDTRDLFSTTLQINRLFELKVELESARRVRTKCEEIQDFKGAEMARKNIVAILSLLPQEEEAAGDLFEGHTIEPVFDPSLIGAPKISKEQVIDLLGQIAKKRGKEFNMNIEDIPFEKA